MKANSVRLFGVDVHGVAIDYRTGCDHYRSPLDVIAIRHCCCKQWFACIECHEALADHPSVVWPKEEFDQKAILCGICGTQLSIREYLANSLECIRCKTPFNPGCISHHHLYFEQ